MVCRKLGKPSKIKSLPTAELVLKGEIWKSIGTLCKFIIWNTVCKQKFKLVQGMKCLGILRSWFKTHQRQWGFDQVSVNEDHSHHGYQDLATPQEVSTAQTRIWSRKSCWLFQTEGSQTSSTRRWMIYIHEVTISIIPILTSLNQGFICLLAIFNEWAGSISSLSCCPLTWKLAKVLTGKGICTSQGRGEAQIPTGGICQAKLNTEEEK